MKSMAACFDSGISSSMLELVIGRKIGLVPAAGTGDVTFSMTGSIVLRKEGRW